jgi:hypothetical protein
VLPSISPTRIPKRELFKSSDKFLIDCSPQTTFCGIKRKKKKIAKETPIKFDLKKKLKDCNRQLEGRTNKLLIYRYLHT